MKTINIPLSHLNAVRSQEGYFNLHRDYRHAYGLNDKEAYQKLENDLQYYNLPERYSSEQSFYYSRHRFTANLIRVNTK